MHNGDTSLGGPQAEFPETVLDAVRRASDTSPEIQRGGFEELCRSYWKPAYHYFRVCWAKSNEDAKDLAQAFFVWLADPKILRRYEPGRGSFRTFLKALLRHFVQHHDEALGRLKRGGGHLILNLESQAAFAQADVPDPRSSGVHEGFEADWRTAVIHRAVEEVRERLRAEGKSIKIDVFERYYMSDGPEPPTYESVARQLGLKPGDVLHYLAEVRTDVREQVRAHFSETASTPEELEEEWNGFFGG